MNQTIERVRVTAVNQHAFKSNLFQAELRQKITREYNAQTISSNMQSAFAPVQTYNLTQSKYEKERVCWVETPKGWTLEMAQKHLDNVYESGSKPCIYQVLSFEPIFTDKDHSWMDKLSEDERELFIENKKNNQTVLNPQTGEIAAINGRTLYRKLFYSEYEREDIDLTKTDKVSAMDKPMVDKQEEAEVEKEILVF